MHDNSQAQDTLATGRWVFQVLGILFGTATLVSLTKSSFAIELSGLPAILYKQYVLLRDFLFEPAVRILAYFGFSLPHWVKDPIMVYGLIAAAYSRAFRVRNSGLRLLSMSAF